MAERRDCQSDRIGPEAVLRILIADDYEVVRWGLRSIITSHPDWAVVSECANGSDAVAEAIRLVPDLCILDFSMPELDGLHATRRIRQAIPDMRVLLLVQCESEALSREVAHVGAAGYVMKSASVEDLRRAIEQTPSAKPEDAAGHDEGEGRDHVASQLTVRERQILQMLAEGANTPKIAATIGISRRTVETHRANLMKKLGLRSLYEIVRYAVITGLIKF